MPPGARAGVADQSRRQQVQRPAQKLLPQAGYLLEELDLSYEDEAHTDLIRELLALPQKYRDVLYLHYYEGYTVPKFQKSSAAGKHRLLLASPGAAGA